MSLDKVTRGDLFPSVSVGEKKPADTRPFWRRFYDDHVNFLRVHIAYFIILGFVGSLIIWGIELGGQAPMEYVDALFTSISAITTTGLIVADTNQLRTGTLVTIPLLVQFGSIVTLSIVPLLIRRRYFLKEFGPEIAQIRPACSSADLERPSFENSISTFDHRVMQFHAMNRLVYIVPSYMLGLMLMMFVIQSIYLTYYAPALFTLYSNNVTSPVGFAGFHVLTAFHNAGFSLFAANLIPFQAATVVLLTLAALVLLGQTMYPVGLRLVVWICSKIARDKEPFRYLLAHPSECFTHLFPALNTLILLIVVAGLNVIEWMLFIGLDWNIAEVAQLAPHSRVLTFFFQSVSTRTCICFHDSVFQFVCLTCIVFVAGSAGFNTFDLSTCDRAVRCLSSAQLNRYALLVLSLLGD